MPSIPEDEPYGVNQKGIVSIFSGKVLPGQHKLTTRAIVSSDLTQTFEEPSQSTRMIMPTLQAHTMKVEPPFAKTSRKLSSDIAVTEEKKEGAQSATPDLLKQLHKMQPHQSKTMAKVGRFPSKMFGVGESAES